MGSIKLQNSKREYEFTWINVVILIVFPIFFFYGLTLFFEYVWLQEILAKMSIWLLNLFSGYTDHVIWVSEADLINLHYGSKFDVGWYLSISGQDDFPVRFTKEMTGIRSVLTFIGIIMATPKSIIPQQDSDIWSRKVKAILVATILNICANILRTWLKITLNRTGNQWASVDLSISLLTLFFTLLIFLWILRDLPELLYIFFWTGHQLYSMLNLEKIQKLKAKEKSKKQKLKDKEKVQKKKEKQQVTESDSGPKLV